MELEKYFDAEELQQLLGEAHEVNVHTRTLTFEVAEEVVEDHLDWSPPVQFKFNCNEDRHSVELWLRRAD